jgi:Ca2+-transporting ATPase
MAGSSLRAISNMRSEFIPSTERSSLPLALSAPHCLPVHSCLAQLSANRDYGLTDMQVEVGRKRYGTNTLPDATRKSFLALVVEQFADKLVQVMLGIAVLSAVIAYMERSVQAYTEPLVILAILVLNSVVGALQSRSAESSLEALKKLQPATASVLRNGGWVYDMPAADLVPGDIIRLRVGDKVPADARVIELRSNIFSTDEGSLTGESTTVLKSIDTVEVSASIADKTNMVSYLTRDAYHCWVSLQTRPYFRYSAELW